MRYSIVRLLLLVPPLCLLITGGWFAVGAGQIEIAAGSTIIWWRSAYAVITAVLLLALSFRQSRIVFVALYLGGIFLFLNKYGGGGNAFLAVVTVATSFPWVMLLLRHLPGRAVLSTAGYLRLVMITGFVLPLFALPALPSCRLMLERHSAGAWLGLLPWLALPGAGLFSAVVCGPLMLLPRKNGNPHAGIYAVFMLLTVFAGLRGISSGISPAPVMTAAGLILLWDVLECSWRNAHLDELTGLHSRRALEHYLACLGSQYVIAMIDIDHFKRVNDRYGHTTGDQVLRYVTSFLERIKGAAVFRYGGEEFAVVERGAGIDDTIDALENLREAIHQRPFILRDGMRPVSNSDGRKSRGRAAPKSDLRISVSIGVAERSAANDTPSAVLAAADQALYKAKRGGRNRLCVAGRSSRGGTRRRGK